MRIGPRLELKQSQRLVMTPQLQQAMRVLHMTSTDVTAFLEGEMERNPLLKLDHGGDRANDAAPEAPRAAGADRPVFFHQIAVQQRPERRH